jgi:hypothetical protein
MFLLVKVGFEYYRAFKNVSVRLLGTAWGPGSLLQFLATRSARAVPRSGLPAANFIFQTSISIAEFWTPLIEWQVWRHHMAHGFAQGLPIRWKLRKEWRNIGRRLSRTIRRLVLNKVHCLIEKFNPTWGGYWPICTDVMYIHAYMEFQCMHYADEWQHADDNVNRDIGENYHSRGEYAVLKYRNFFKS